VVYIPSGYPFTKKGGDKKKKKKYKEAQVKEDEIQFLHGAVDIQFPFGKCIGPGFYHWYLPEGIGRLVPERWSCNSIRCAGTW